LAPEDDIRGMPELPEVETIKRQLNNFIVGKKIKKIEIRLPKIVQLMAPIKFKSLFQGTTIKKVSRRGKVLIISLNNNYSLVIHFKLTGQIIFIPPRDINQKIDKHTHLIYYFDDNSCLIHNDIRQFGYVRPIKTNELDEYFAGQNFGPEPLEKDFTLKKFIELLKHKPNQKIKPLLIDQTFISGIGNIYSQEICFCAKILPTRLIKTLADRDIKNIYKCLKQILKNSIKYRGTSSDTYLDAQGKEGDYVPRLRVYGREGKKCFRCGGMVKKITLAERGTSYCPSCQR